MEINIDHYLHTVNAKMDFFPKSDTYCLFFNKQGGSSGGYKDGEEIAEIRMQEHELDNLIEVLQGLKTLGSFYLKEESEVAND